MRRPTVDTGGRPVLVVGDVHGDFERLFRALAPYPADRWFTLFLGDLVDGGPFGAGALRFARDRPHSEVLIGNHEALMLAALRESRASARGPVRARWLGVGGQEHDLEELARRPDLEAWLRERPALVRLDDGTLAQHSDNDGYWKLADGVVGSAGGEADVAREGRMVGEAEVAGGADADPVEAVNAGSRRRLADGAEEELWDALTARDVFRRQPWRLESWLGRMQAPRVVHGHSPHRAPRPDAYAGGRAVCFDGGLGRWGGSPFQRRSAPAAATVGPLPPLVD